MSDTNLNISPKRKDFAAPARRALAAFAHPCASSANIFFYVFGYNATRVDNKSKNYEGRADKRSASADNSGTLQNLIRDSLTIL